MYPFRTFLISNTKRRKYTKVNALVEIFHPQVLQGQSFVANYTLGFLVVILGSILSFELKKANAESEMFQEWISESKTLEKGIKNASAKVINPGLPCLLSTNVSSSAPHLV